MGKPKCCLEMSSYWLTFPIMSDDSTRMLKMANDPIFLIIIAPSGYKNGYNSTFSVHFFEKTTEPDTIIFATYQSTAQPGKGRCYGAKMDPVSSGAMKCRKKGTSVGVQLTVHWFVSAINVPWR